MKEALYGPGGSGVGGPVKEEEEADPPKEDDVTGLKGEGALVPLAGGGVRDEGRTEVGGRE